MRYKFVIVVALALPACVHKSATLDQAPEGGPEPGQATAAPTETGGLEDREAVELPSEFSATSRAGKYTVVWRPAEGSIPLNETFELDVEVTRVNDGSPVSGADVYVDAGMPEHNHGMLREPKSREVSPGVYRVEGMLLHMTGYWQVFVNVIEGGVAEAADFELTLE